jgi:hypothetical protein
MTKRIAIEFPSAGATYSRPEYGVYQYDAYPRSSVLAGQERRTFLASFETREAARLAHPGADETGCQYQPPFLGHLPDEQDDRDETPVEMTERTLERWDFDADPDWR